VNDQKRCGALREITIVISAESQKNLLSRVDILLDVRRSYMQIEKMLTSTQAIMM
jgi:hypothetical protein